MSDASAKKVLEQRLAAEKSEERANAQAQTEIAQHSADAAKVIAQPDQQTAKDLIAGAEVEVKK